MSVARRVIADSSTARSGSTMAIMDSPQDLHTPLPAAVRRAARCSKAAPWRPRDSSGRNRGGGIPATPGEVPWRHLICSIRWFPCCVPPMMASWPPKLANAAETPAQTPCDDQAHAILCHQRAGAEPSIDRKSWCRRIRCIAAGLTRRRDIAHVGRRVIPRGRARRNWWCGHGRPCGSGSITDAEKGRLPGSRVMSAAPRTPRDRHLKSDVHGRPGGGRSGVKGARPRASE